MHVLWMDIGNTRLKYWVTPETVSHDHPDILAHGAIIHYQNEVETLRTVMEQVSQYSFGQIRIASVLKPEANQRIQAHLQSRDVAFASTRTRHTAIHSDYDLTQLGIDRWLQVLAAATEGQNCCVIGCGTALTVDFLEGNHHRGGYILPGLALQRAALAQGTHLVQVFQGNFGQTDYGVTTPEAVNNGISRLFLSLIRDIEQQVPRYILLFTGGDAGELTRMLPPATAFQKDDLLLLKGLIRNFSAEP